jgi:hypothetical protein
MPPEIEGFTKIRPLILIATRGILLEETLVPDGSYFDFAARYPALVASCSVINFPCLVAPYHLPPL